MVLRSPGAGALAVVRERGSARPGAVGRPLSLVLHTAGWTPAFLGSASVAVVALVAVVVAVRDRPTGDAPPPRVPWGESMRELARSLRRPGTQLGFWSHFVTQSSGVVFSLLWGFPFLVGGLGYSPALASGLLIAIVASGMVVGPVIGILTGRFPFRRSNLVLGIVVMMGVAWGILLLWPGTPRSPSWWSWWWRSGSAGPVRRSASTSRAPSTRRGAWARRPAS
ncbi:MFS transporter [Clavibacter zhangzhiyongii]|uniref:MFS transporter n=1 Tax=Clavibacter zhangzhiyongii TaxID=2768071 RepID=UPI0039E16CCB